MRFLLDLFNSCSFTVGPFKDMAVATTIAVSSNTKNERKNLMMNSMNSDVAEKKETKETHPQVKTMMEERQAIRHRK